MNAFRPNDPLITTCTFILNWILYCLDWRFCLVTQRGMTQSWVFCVIAALFGISEMFETRNRGRNLMAFQRESILSDGSEHVRSVQSVRQGRKKSVDNKTPDWLTAKLLCFTLLTFDMEHIGFGHVSVLEI